MEQQELFRKESVERVSSPEQLSDYLHVTSPAIWVVLAAEVSGWASEAVHWCVMHGVLNGKDGRLVPGGSATRAEAAAMLLRCSAVLAS